LRDSSPSITTTHFLQSNTYRSTHSGVLPTGHLDVTKVGFCPYVRYFVMGAVEYIAEEETSRSSPYHDSHTVLPLRCLHHHNQPPTARYRPRF
jgi:hypothetical protein